MFYPLYPIKRPMGDCRYLRLSVCPSCPSVYPSVSKSAQSARWLVIDLNSTNWHQTCIIRYSRLVLNKGVTDLNLQGYFGHLTQNSRKVVFSAQLVVTDFGLNHQICTKHAYWGTPLILKGFELELPILHQIYILGFSWLLLKMWVSALFFVRWMKMIYAKQLCALFSFNIIRQNSRSRGTKMAILMRIERFRTWTQIWNLRWLRNSAHSLK